MTVYKLMLTPVAPDTVPADADGLSRALQELEFIGMPFPLVGATHYLPGDRFLDLITFLGCSPVVAAILCHRAVSNADGERSPGQT